MVFSYRLSREYFRRSWMQLTLGIMLLLPVAIGLTLLYKAWPILNSHDIVDVLSGSEWKPMQGKFGLWPFVCSSVIVAVMALLIMIPVCLAAAVYITQFASRWASSMLRSAIDILAGIPSVIFGLWGVITIVPVLASWAAATGAENTSGYSILAGGIVVSVSVMPFVLNMLIELFQSVSMDLKETALSLGASHWQAIKDVVLRKVRPGVTAAFTLGVSKAFGETIAVLMVVGNVVQIPRGPFDPGYPLPALLANNYGEMMSVPSYEAVLMLSALVLLVVVIVFNYMAHKVIRYYHTQT